MKLSIVIATHRRPDSLARLMASLAPQLRPGAEEIFVAENGAPEPLELDLRAIAPGIEVIQIHDPRPGKCRVQNRAIARARGAIIACLDDDLAVAPDYAAAVERFFDDFPQYAAMKGRILPAEDPREKAGAMAPYLDLPIADHGDRTVEVRGVLGANMAFRTDALRAAGPFDERLGPGACGHEEETEMARRLTRAGYRIGYAPKALALHEVDPARADRARFIRIARERGFCRTLHERHTLGEALVKQTVAAARLAIARIAGAGVERIAREERRLAIARGMRDGVRRRAD